MNVSVIIPVFQQYDSLSNCLAALARQQLPSEEFEVIVVQNDTQYTQITTQYPFQLSVLHCLTPGSYAARNTALARAKGNVLAFTDADCVPQPGWLLHGVRRLLEEGEDCYVGGKVLIVPAERSRPNRWELYDMVVGIDQREYGSKGYFATANMFAFAKSFDTVGTFNERLFSAGDTDWGLRASRLGYRPVYEPAAVVEHPARDSAESIRKKTRRLLGGKFYSSRRSPFTFLSRIIRTWLPPVHALRRLSHARSKNRKRVPLPVFLVLLRDVWVEQIYGSFRIIFGKHYDRS